MLLRKYKYIVIEGNIGAGKTSLATKLSEDIGGRLVLEEFAENSFLPKFYQNPSKYAFPLELSFLAARYKQLNYIFKNQDNRTVIGDYHFHKSLLFATSNLDEAELQLYLSFFELIEPSIPEPELLIFLNRDLKHLQENISKRDRDYEKEISHTYLEKIESGYKNLLSEHPFSKVLKVECNDLDFINNKNHYKTIIDLINKESPET
ncbi:MAG: deoxynucleoside kinase [Bacteroidetes bacterium]|nr:deoxynucleoside kinase [Bacteroidota bacterium]